MSKVKANNKELIEKLSYYLDNNPRQITQEDLDNVKKSGVSELYAYSLLVLHFLELDDLFLDKYLNLMIRKEKASEYENNPFYQRMKDINGKVGKLEFNYTYIEPLELFRQDEIDTYLDGRLFPQIGFFDDDLRCLTILEKEKILYRYTPYLVNSMVLPLEEVSGKVSCMGLGTGYFAYMAHLKDDVKTLNIYEKNMGLVELFNQYMLPKFDHPEKIKVIFEDPINVLKDSNRRLNSNFVFINCWDSLNQGLKLYPKYKALEKKHPRIKYKYYLEQSIKACQGD